MKACPRNERRVARDAAGPRASLSRPALPAFAGKLSKDEIAAAYVRALGK